MDEHKQLQKKLWKQLLSAYQDPELLSSKKVMDQSLSEVLK